jgi:outer membrane protein TolC
MKMLKYQIRLWVIVTTILTVISFTQAQEMETRIFNLEQCIQIALENNPQILASQIGVSESKINIREARAGYYPSLNLSAVASSLTAESASSNTRTTENYNTVLSARYTIFQGWKTVASVEAARQTFKAAQAGHHSSRQDMVLTVTEAYYWFLQAQKFVQVAEKSLHRARKRLDFARARFNAGLASRSDILKARTEQSNAQLNLIHAQNAALMARGQLNNTMGQNVDASLQIVDDLIETVVNDTPGTELDFRLLVEEAYKYRPELRKMARQLQAQKSFIRIAKADYYPSISLDANYNFSGAAISQLYQSNYIGINLSLPLFSGFSRPARIEREKMGLQSIEKQMETLRQQISLEVWNAFLAVKEAKERILNTQVFLKDARENLNISEGAYKEGVGSMLDVIDAQTTFVIAEQSYIEALADYRKAQIVLERPISGKFLRRY